MRQRNRGAVGAIGEAEWTLWSLDRRECQGEISVMRSSIGRIVLMVLGSVLVVAISFFATLQILDYWLVPDDPNADVIHVAEATYGLNCKDFTPPPGHANLAKPGNATTVMAQACDATKATCLFIVDAVKLGDPASGCGKDFTARWRCGNDQKVHDFFLAAEAAGRTAVLSCPAP